MRLVAQGLGWILLSLGAVVLCLDLFNSTQKGTLGVTDLGALWNSLDTTSLQLAQVSIERYVHPDLWDPVVTSLLLTPAFAVLGVLGLVLLVLTGTGRHFGRKGRFSG